MIRYLDTSVLISALTHEAASDRTRAWFDRQEPGNLIVSDLVTTEVLAALSIKLRPGAIDETERAEALAVYRHLIDRSLRVLPVERAQFAAAARLADQYVLGLRSADALHLAIASDHGATLSTLDQRLATAAGALGLAAELV